MQTFQNNLIIYVQIWSAVSNSFQKLFSHVYTFADCGFHLEVRNKISAQVRMTSSKFNPRCATKETFPKKEHVPAIVLWLIYDFSESRVRVTENDIYVSPLKLLVGARPTESM